MPGVSSAETKPRKIGRNPGGIREKVLRYPMRKVTEEDEHGLTVNDLSFLAQRELASRN
jgi:hypothetical protein